jgi:TM2 domain-containing membrane protein YozV
MSNDTYFLLLNGQQTGPYTVNQMRSMWQTGSINSATSYWQEGMASWRVLADIRPFLDGPASNQVNNQVVVNQVSQTGFAQPVLIHPPKSRGVFIVLGLFFGCLGVHNFYAGYSGKGVAQLLITVLLGWVFGLGLIITAVWALIEIIAVSTDAHGMRMT